jgi:hypothetical protein
MIHCITIKQLVICIIPIHCLKLIHCIACLIVLNNTRRGIEVAILLCICRNQAAVTKVYDMKRNKQINKARFIRHMIGVLIVNAIWFYGNYSNAKVVIDDGNTNVQFKVNGEKVTPDVAARKAISDPSAEIQQCKPIKKATDIDGKTVLAYNCKEVDYQITAKTGASHWKNK